jgi:nucleoside-triphosphatase THEP1
MIPKAGKIWIITGEREAGKTHFCRMVIDAAQSKQLSVTGILSPAVVENGIKTGIDVLDVSKNEKRQLAARREEDPHAITPLWRFDELSLRWGSEILKKVPVCDLFILDELGPLELLHNQGWVEGIRVLDRRAFYAALVVIRPQLLEPGRQRWPDAKLIEIHRNDLPEKLNGTIEQILNDLILQAH